MSIFDQFKNPFDNISPSVREAMEKQEAKKKEKRRLKKSFEKARTGTVGLFKDKKKNIADKFKVKQNQQGVAQLREFSQGKSPWLQMAEQRIDKDLSQNLSNTGAQAQAGIQEATSALASGGGFGRGAENRLERTSNFQRLMNQQQLRSAADMGKLGLREQYATAQQGAIQALPGAEIASMQGRDANIQNMLGEKARDEEFKKRKYQIRMGDFTAGKTADAMEAYKDKGIWANLGQGIKDIF